MAVKEDITYLSSVLVLLAQVVLSVAVLATVTQAQVPVGDWTFDDGSGTKAVDSSGNGNTATLVNGINWVTGKVSGAVSANGVNQFVSIPPIDLSGTNAVTVALWSNRTYSTGGGHVLFEATTNFNYSTTGFVFRPDDDTCHGIQAALHGNLGYSTNCYSQPSSGDWHHLAVVFDKSQTGGNEVAFYVDGILQTPSWNLYASTNTNNFGDNSLYLFSRAGTSHFDSGMVDDFRIYNSALTATQIQQIYNGATLVSVAVTPTNPSTDVGQQQQFTATGTYTDGSQQNLTNSVTWTSTAPSVATISSSGLATAVAAGSTTIQAVAGSIMASTSLTVTGGSITLDGNVHGVQDNGLSASTTATVSIGTPTAGDLISCAVTFDSGNGNTLVSVSDNQNGTYSAAVPVHLNTAMVQWYGIYYRENVAGSPTTITLTTSQSRPYAAISCQAWRGVATSNSLDSSFAQLRDAVATPNPTTGANRTPAVNGDLVIAAVGLLNAGNPTPDANYTLIDGATTTRWWPEYWVQATTTPTAGNFTWPSDTFTDMMAAFRPSASSSLVSVAVTPATPSIAAGQQQQFTATGTFSDGSHQDLTTSAAWASSAPSVAVISSGGLATAIAAGSTTIQATSGSISGSAGLTVTPPTLVSIAVTPATPSIAAGQQQQFTATGTYTDGSHQDLTTSAAWASSALSVAVISSGGLATAVAAGSTTIQATSGSISGSATLTVTSQPLVSLAWTASTSSGIAGYNAYRSNTSGGPYAKLNSSLISNTIYNDQTVQSGFTYYYVTTAVNSQQVESSYSNEAVATVP